jgi:LmbE family N-acetylglucosaminyl deacetylase
MSGVRAVFVSPHMDDVALSCGGLVAQRAAAGDRPLIVTVFAKQPDANLESSEITRALQLVDGTAIDAIELWRRRRSEDAAAAATLGADLLWLDLPDAAYRDGRYRSWAELFGDQARVKSEDTELADRLARELGTVWKKTSRADIYVPLGVGSHVDHQLCYSTAQALRDMGASVWHYEDFPYSLGPGARERRLDTLGLTYVSHVVDVTTELDRRLEAIACYTSQLAPLFAPFGDFRRVTRRYAASLGPAQGRYGERLWSPDGTRTGRSGSATTSSTTA